MKTDLTVAQGPSKYDLLVALGDRHLGRFVKLTLHMPGNTLVEVEVLVSSIAIEDGSGDSWMVGFSRGKNFPVGDASHTGLVGFYNTKTRRGAVALSK